LRNPLRRARRFIAFMLLGLLAVVWAQAIGHTSPVQALEGRSLDWRFQFRGPIQSASSPVVLIPIEEGAELPYRSPIPRSHLASVIEKLPRAALVGLDIFLDRPSFDEEGDARLKKALAEVGKVVAVSYLEDGEEHLPHPYFREALLDRGYATFAIGTDAEVVRRGTLWREVEGRRLLSLAGCLYVHWKGLDTEGVRSGEIELTERAPLINFSGPANAVYREREGMAGGFPICPSHLVARGIYPEDFFEGKIVLIGSGLMDAPDRFRTPFFASAYGYEKTYGVEIHGQLLETLLRGGFLQEPGVVQNWLVVAVLVLLAAGLVLFADALKGGIGALVLLAVWWGGGFALFTRWGIVVPLIAPSLGLAVAFGAATGYHALIEGREKRMVRKLFEKYLAPDVVRQLLDDPSCWELGGKTIEITVMFADLEGFTSVSERLAPQELVKLINRFLNEMSRVIWMEGGTIDKYEGDLIMAFFGAPLPQVDHAARACRCGLKMQERMAELRREWQAQGLPELKVRIGLHSGSAVVGNMGSDFRLSYTAMGDAVNLASRLEGANKEFGTYLMVSQVTRELAGEREEFKFRELGEIKVRGKSVPVSVCELLRGGN
jgi:adenylate cyclase